MRRHPVAHMFARVTAVEDGMVWIGDGDDRTQVTIEEGERKDMDKDKGRELNRRIHELAMRLHKRENFTHVVACDGSKKVHTQQPRNVTYPTGPTAYGHYEGHRIHDGHDEDTWRARFRTAHPTTHEMADAIKTNVHGHRIGNEDDTMQAELAAIFTYLQRVTAHGHAHDKRILIMSDCHNALCAIEETWRGEGKAYRQRAGGAIIEAINALREGLGRVVFIFTPSHAGVVPNAYADGVAKAYLHDTRTLRLSKVVAQHVTSRSVVYEKRDENGDAQLKDGQVFKHTRKGIMEWIRGRTRVHESNVTWNQGVMRAIGKGPKPPQDEEGHARISPEEAHAYAKYATQRMRITCGCRNGYIAGGAQGEAPMLRASHTEGSCAAMIITSGCRGCNMKGIWPGVRETTAHALLGCAGKQVGDLISWCAAVEKKLTYMIEYTKRKIGDDACTMCAQLTRALEAVKDRGVSEVNFMALRHTVGGKLPWWDHNKEERDIKYNGAMIEHVTQLQDLFIERTKAWCAYVAPATWRRQARWESRHWARMLLHILRHNAKGRWARRRAVRHIGAKLIYAYREDGPALRTQHVTRTTRKQAVRRRMRRVIWDLVYNQDELVLVLQMEYHKGKKVDEERVGKVEAWVDAAHHKKDRGRTH